MLRLNQILEYLVCIVQAVLTFQPIEVMMMGLMTLMQTMQTCHDL